MYEMLRKLAVRPDPYSLMTVKSLWTRPHIARQMLKYHLDQDTHLASRPIAIIEQIVDWLDSELKLDGKRVCDLGCGPGLYSLQLADRGASVTGVDFSSIAIAHAQNQASTADSDIEYLVADYMQDDLPRDFDIVMLIYFDYCALSARDRHTLLRRIHSMLKPGGSLVMDVVADGAFRDTCEQLAIEENLMDGFWSDSDYVGIHRTWLYPGQMLTLDHYAIVEPSDQWQILNWMQYFSPDRLVRELEDAGYAMRVLTGSLDGTALSDASREIGVIAEAHPARAL
jgi:SAM-dependent methyltransferase